MEATQSELCHEAYYFFQLYLPSRWRNRKRQFPILSHYALAQAHLIELNRAPDFKLLRDKLLFARRCQQAGLPSISSLAVFVDGQPTEELTALPAKDLISKPSSDWRGTGVELWRYDPVCDQFSNAMTGYTLRAFDLFQHFCDLSHSRQIIIQERLQNHECLSPLTNGALSTLRLVTCRSPSGTIDLMPPVIKMPVGHRVVDNLAQGGLAAPIDLMTGVICGPGLQKHSRLGVVYTDKHPDSRHELSGFRVPMWKEVVDLALRAHWRFPSVHFIGWDIAVLQDGPVLVEGNALFDSDLTVLPHGITLSDTQFIPYYNYHWNCALAEIRPRS